MELQTDSDISINKGTYKEVNNCKDNETLVIEKTGIVDIDIQDNIPEGRRIIDLAFLFKELHKTFDNHARGIDCQFKDWRIETTHFRGLLTQLIFKCKMCHYRATIWSEPVEPKVVDINTVAVATTITAGIGYSTLEEMCARMNIRCMSEVTYIKYRENIIDDFEKTAIKNMKLAGEVEKQLAVERNETIIDSIGSTL